ncbi:zf-HC2 domain-containing protein [Corynebacterium pyruviciproducens]|uniref:zf-HC2 domain-containing protein n=1 Tax=Corynebacterium pyruviciproducens TaxID=598660 RepID=UPI002549E89A|nr:zf-HC2 domain-containing protein [Corynebacterium pyruviciproducens]MDK6566698.1 zf-HC2 domain-containing protein [Corynebacterium pyruviciproducens]
MINCQDIQRAISARLDNEPADIDDTIIEAHLEGCAECRAYLDNARIMKTQFEHDDTEAPDLTDLILAGVGPQVRQAENRRATSLALARIALVLTGFVFVVWSVGTLVESTRLIEDDVFSVDPNVTKMVIQLAAARVALGFGLFFAAWKTRLVTGMLPIFATLWTFSFGFAARDVVLGTIATGDVVGLMILLCATLVLVWTWLSQDGRSFLFRAWQTANARPEF